MDDVHILIGINQKHISEVFKSNTIINFLIEGIIMSVILLQRWPSYSNNYYIKLTIVCTPMVYNIIIFSFNLIFFIAITSLNNTQSNTADLHGSH